MSKKDQNPKDNDGKMKELADVLRTLIDKIEIHEIPKTPDDDNYCNPLDDEEDNEEYEKDDDCYVDLLLDTLYDVFEIVQGNVPIHYMGPDVTTGLLGLITLHGEAIVNSLAKVSSQITDMEGSLSKLEAEKIELLKKQNK